MNVTSFTPPPPPPITLPDGRAVDTVPQGELYTALDRLAVPGFSHSLGRDEAIGKYATHLRAVHDEAGRAAVAAWLVSKRSG